MHGASVELGSPQRSSFRESDVYVRQRDCGNLDVDRQRAEAEMLPARPHRQRDLAAEDGGASGAVAHRIAARRPSQPPRLRLIASSIHRRNEGIDPFRTSTAVAPGIRRFVDAEAAFDNVKI